MKNIVVILSCFLSICAVQQIQAQEQNTDITLVDIAWKLDWEGQSIDGRYKMINNLNKKITIKRIYIQQNNWCRVTPWINKYRADSLILQPFEQREFTYGCSFIKGHFYAVDILIRRAAAQFKLDSTYLPYPGIDFAITYYKDNNYSEQKTYCGRLNIWLDNLADFPDELIDNLIPYANCEKYKQNLEWAKKHDSFNLNEWAKWNMTLFEQRICPCIVK